jgi:predicted flap endonuclease-1-like 5' DNA nuclease
MPPSDHPLPTDLTARRRRRAEREAALSELQAELESLRRARDGEARRLEARITHLEAVIPELWERDRRLSELAADLERERSARAEAETRVAILEEEVELLRRSLGDERERSARMSGAGAPGAPVDPYRLWEQRFRERTDAAAEDRLQRMQRRIDQQATALEEKETRITRLVDLVARLDPDPGPDDLTRIGGIGPVIAAILHDNGITRFEDLAAFGPGDVARIGSLLPVYPGRITDDSWVEQARDLVREREERRRRREGMP